MGQDPHVQNAVASARLEGVDLESTVVAILEVAATGEVTSDQARREILAKHGVELPVEHRLSQTSTPGGASAPASVPAAEGRR